MSTPGQAAPAAENPKPCRRWAPAPGFLCKHTFCIMKSENSINVSALYSKQQRVIFIFCRGNEILSIPSVIKEDAKEKLFK